MKLSNKTYDILKIIVWVFAPLATLIAAICVIWGIPYSEQITATLAAINAFLGSLLGKSNADYNKEQTTEVYNSDLLKDMLGFDEYLNLMGEAESEEEDEEESEE